jgi:hypothetical protein
MLLSLLINPDWKAGLGRITKRPDIKCNGEMKFSEISNSFHVVSLYKQNRLC